MAWFSLILTLALGVWCIIRWARRGFWIPRYVHVLAIVCFCIGAVFCVTTWYQYGLSWQMLVVALVVGPALVYFMSIFFGGVEEAAARVGANGSVNASGSSPAALGNPRNADPMIPQLEAAHHVRDFIIHVRFSDGTAADVDLANELWGEVFEPLKDPRVFQAMRLDRELNTVVWSTGADLAPEWLYEKATAARRARAAG